MLICQICAKENLPFTDSRISVEGTIHGGFDSPGGIVSGGGAALQLVEYCQFCGTRIAELCEVCRHLHASGFIFCATTGKNRKEFLADQFAEQEKREVRRAESERQQADLKAQKKITEERLRQEFRDSYQERWESRRSLIRTLTLVAMGVSIAFGVFGWMHFHSIMARISVTFVSFGILGVALYQMEYRLIKLPAKIAAWGSPSSWTEPEQWLI